MSTALKFGSALLFQKLTSLYMYPHILSLNLQTNRWEVEKNGATLIPFYTVTIFFLLIAVFGGTLLEVWKTAQGIGSMPPFLAMMTLTLGVLSSYGWGFSMPAMKYAPEMACYMNAVYDFETRLRGDPPKWTAVLRPISTVAVNVKNVLVDNSVLVLSGKRRKKQKPNDNLFNILKYLKYLYQEMKGLFIKGSSTDLVGICMNLMVLYMIPFSIFLGPLGMYLEMDPFNFFYKDLSINSVDTMLVIRIPFEVLRLFIISLAAMECMRTFLLFINPLLHHYIIYLKSIQIIKNLQFNRKTLNIYVNLRLVHQYGDWMVQYSILLTLSTGFYLAIMFNCFTVVGWKYCPLSIYISGVPITPVIYFLILGAQHIWSQCHLLSSEMIKNEWVRNGSKDVRMWEIRRMVRCQRPIVFCSGSFATMNRETKRHTLDFLVTYTVNALLLFSGDKT